MLPILGFLGLSILELGGGKGQTDRHLSPFYNATSLSGVGHNKSTIPIKAKDMKYT